MNGWMEDDAWTAPGGDYDKVNSVCESEASFVMVSASWPALPPTAHNMEHIYGHENKLLAHYKAFNEDFGLVYNRFIYDFSLKKAVVYYFFWLLLSNNLFSKNKDIKCVFFHL